MSEFCAECGAPERRLWSFALYRTFKVVAVENWMSLKECEACGRLWCEVPHEPYASFSFWTLWPGTREQWARLILKDAGRACPGWHDSVIREDYLLLPKDEQVAIEQWRDRTYRRFNPIDHGPGNSAPIYCHALATIANSTSPLILTYITLADLTPL